MKHRFVRLSTFTMKQKRWFKRFIYLSLIVFLFSYFSSTIQRQDVLLPDNPITELTEDRSMVPLMGGFKDLVHAEERTETEDEAESKEEERKDEAQADKQDQEEAEASHTEVNERIAVGESPSTAHQDGFDEQMEGGGQGTSQDSQVIEVVDDPEARIKEYFHTTIEDGATVTRPEYSFTIKQLQDEYQVKDIAVSMSRTEAKLTSISDPYEDPVLVESHLAEGENQIRIAIRYEDQEGLVFTVSRSYTVHYNQQDIIIFTDLSDGTVTVEEWTFTAYAELAGERVPLDIRMNDQLLDPVKQDNYTVKLEEGDNHFSLEAKGAGKVTESNYTIRYEKPQLRIDTDLKDQTVKQEALVFNAVAYANDEKIDLEVSHNNTQLAPSSKDRYEAKLQLGENTFVLKAKYLDEEIEASYTVHYQLEKEEEVLETEKETEQENKYAPIIEVYDIKDGQTLKGATKTFHVRGKTYDGKSITAGNGVIRASNNGKAIKIDWTDSSQISFTLEVANGENNIVITATDREGNEAVKTLTVYGEITDGVIGKVTISVEATTIGLGYIIPPEEVEIYQGDRGSHVIDRLFKKHGISYDYTGKHDNSFYLSAIYRPGLVVNPVIPEDLASLLEKEMSRYDPEDYHSDSLGEFDFTNGSGWMYSVDGNYPNVGFADYYFEDGQVVRIRFTLAYGADIGGGMPGENFGKEW